MPIKCSINVSENKFTFLNSNLVNIKHNNITIWLIIGY